MMDGSFRVTPRMKMNPGSIDLGVGSSGSENFRGRFLTVRAI